MLGDETNTKLIAGMKLPIPYVEKATVFDNNIEVTVGLYLVVPIEQSIEDSIEPIKDLHFYVGQIIDGVPNDYLVSSINIKYTEQELEIGTLRMANLMAGEGAMNLIVDVTNSNFEYDSFSKSDDTPYVLGNHKIFSSLTIDDFQFTNSQIMDVEDSVTVGQTISSKVLKFIASTTLTCEHGTPPSESAYVDSLDLNLTMSLVCFSSMIDLSGMNMSSGNEYVDASRNSIRNLELYNLMFSQPSFKEVFINGVVDVSPTKLFMLPNNIIYNGDAIQTIDGSFYTSDRIDREQIVNRFSSIIPSEEYIMNAAEGFQSALTAFKSIINNYRDSEELLPRLHVFGQTYIDKTTTTQAGIWYQKFNSTLMNANNQVFGLEARLFRELITTPTVVDGRTVDQESYSIPDTSEYDDSKFVYADPGTSLLMSRTAHYATTYGDSIQESELTYNYTLVENGYFFFDYEKASRTQTVLSKVFDVDVLTDLLGIGSSYINKYYKLSSVNVTRLDSSGDGVFSKTTHFTDSLEDLSPSIQEMQYFIYDERAKNKFQVSGETIYPTLALRNVVLPDQGETNEIFSDYKLMCFEFQDIMPSAAAWTAGSSSPRNNDAVSIDVRLVDYSKQLISDITASCTNFLTGAFNYYCDAAEEFCSYNNIDGHFNDFFIDAMNEQFSGSSDTIPWIAGPTIYNIHRELITGVFNGDMDKLTNSTIILSEQISPETGDLENLRLFKQNFENLNDFYLNLDLSQYDEEEDHLFETHFLTSALTHPDVMNWEPTGEVGFDSAIESWVSFMEDAIEVFKSDVTNLIFNSLTVYNQEEATEFVNTPFELASDMFKAITTLMDLIESGDLEGYTPEEMGVAVYTSLAAVGVSATIASAIVAHATTTATLSFWISAGVVAAPSLGAFIALALPIVLIVVLVASIIAIIVTAVAREKRRELTKNIEKKLYDFIIKLSTKSNEISQSASIQMPSNYKSIMESCNQYHPELTYGIFLLLGAIYSELDPDGEEKIGDSEDVNSVVNIVPIPGFTSGIDQMLDFIIERAMTGA